MRNLWLKMKHQRRENIGTYQHSWGGFANCLVHGCGYSWWAFGLPLGSMDPSWVRFCHNKVLFPLLMMKLRVSKWIISRSGLLPKKESESETLLLVMENTPSAFIAEVHESRVTCLKSKRFGAGLTPYVFFNHSVNVTPYRIWLGLT